MPNKIILISSYCNTEEKIQVLQTNIIKLKNLGFDVMLNSPIDLPNSVSSLCDFYIRTKENPVFDLPGKCVYSWADYKTKDKTIRVLRTLPDYGWANIYQVKKLSEYALTYDYEYFYHIIYDLVIDDQVVSELTTETKCKFYHFHEHKVSLHMMLFDKRNLCEFISKIKVEEYLQYGGIAETWLENFIQKTELDYTISDQYVEDHIHYHRGIDLYNYSEFSDFKFFLTKNGLRIKNVELYFYEVSHPTNITLEINGVLTQYSVKDRDIIDLGLTADIIESLTIHYNGLKQDITDTLEKITHNAIEIIE